MQIQDLSESGEELNIMAKSKTPMVYKLAQIYTEIWKSGCKEVVMKQKKTSAPRRW